ncbi:MAG: hypothetical protein NTY53_02870 [Kiritimatiellaeota bacterium]|nr:hypothetical protein [Kiritimatiellota bacterium]
MNIRELLEKAREWLKRNIPKEDSPKPPPKKEEKVPAKPVEVPHQVTTLPMPSGWMQTCFMATAPTPILDYYKDTINRGCWSTLPWYRHGNRDEDTFRNWWVAYLKSIKANAIVWMLQGLPKECIELQMFMLGTASPVDGHQIDECWPNICTRNGITTQIPLLFDSPDPWAQDTGKHEEFIKWLCDSIKWAKPEQFIICIGLEVNRNASAQWTPAYISKLAGWIKQYSGGKHKVAAHASYPQCIEWCNVANVDQVVVECWSPWEQHTPDEMKKIIADVVAKCPGKQVIAGEYLMTGGATPLAQAAKDAGAVGSWTGVLP